MENKVRLLSQYKEDELEKDINSFLSLIDMDGGKLIDIKFNCAVSIYQETSETEELYSALIIYQTPEIRTKPLRKPY